VNKIELALCKAIEPTLAAQGFKLNRSLGGFFRYGTYGFDDFLVVDKGTAQFGPGEHEIGCPCGIRHDRIEVPWNSLGFIHGESNKLTTATLVLGFPRGSAAPALRVSIRNREGDLAIVARSLEATFVECALPFYARFSDLREVESFANDRPLADLSPYTFGLPLEHRAMRSLLLAKAVRPDRYPIVRAAFLNSEKKTMFPRDRCLEMLATVDGLTV
jgi:hypothetical protein